jgi:hypothetical protein
MFLTKIHHRRMVTVVSFRNSLFRKLHQIFDCPLELRIFNLQGSNIGCNTFLVLKNIIFNRGPNMASQRFYVHNHDQSFHQGNSSVNLYFWLSSFNVGSNFMLLCHVKSNKAFLINHVKLSSLTSRRYIPAFLLQCFVHIYFLIFLVNTMSYFTNQSS